MNEKLIEVVSTISGIDKAELTEKIKTDEGITEVSTKLSGLKVFKSEQEHLGFLDNFLKAKEPAIKDAAYAESKKSIHEKIEKDFKKKYGFDAWEHGKDYTTTDEMLEKLIAEKSKNPTDSKAEIDKRDAKIKELTEKREQELADAIKPFSTEINDLMIENALETLRPLVNIDKDKVDGQLDFVKFQFEKAGLKIGKKDNKRVVLKPDGSVYTNDLYQPLTVAEVFKTLAEANIPLHKQVPAGGRGASNTGQGQSNGGDTIDFTQFAGADGWERFKQTERGKQLTTGSPESNELYAKWRKLNP